MIDGSVDETIQTYDRIAVQFAERNFAAPLDAERDSFARAVVGNAPVELFRILDAGCGPGRDSKWFNERGFQTIGVDGSAGMLAEARRRVPGVDFRQADLRSLTFPDGFFDGIWCCASLLHLRRTDVPGVLTSFNRLLGHGYLWLSVKAGDGEETVDGTYGPDTLRRFTYFRRDEIELFLERAGFDVHDVAVGETTASNSHPWIQILAQTKLSTALPGAVAVIVDRGGRVLLSERADGRGWNLPGGVLGEQESPDEAVIRETKEETGLDVEVLRLVGIGSWSRTTQTLGAGWRAGVVSNAYLCRVVGGELIPTTEALQHRWCHPDSLPEPIASRWHADAIAAAIAARQGRLVWPVTKRYGVKARSDSAQSTLGKPVGEQASGSELS